MPSLQEIQAFLAQQQLAAQNGINQNIDQPIQNKLAALHKLSNNPVVSEGNGSAAGPGMAHNNPPGNAAMAAMANGGGPGAPIGAGVGSMDEMMAQRQKILDMNNAASAQNQAGSDDMSGYQDVKPFQALKSKISTPDDEDEDDKNTRGSTRDTGTTGGV